MNRFLPGRATRATQLGALWASFVCVLVVVSLLPGAALASALSFKMDSQRSAGARARPLLGLVQRGVVSSTADGLSVRTLEPLSLTSSEVVLAGYIDPAKETTHVRFEVGLAGTPWCNTDGAGGSPSTSPWYELKNNEEPTVVGVLLKGLNAGYAYCYEVVAEDASSGVIRGGQVSFVAGAPAAYTAEARATGPGAAIVEGEIDPASQRTEYWVDYGRANSTWCETGGATGMPEGSSERTVLGSEDEEFHEVAATLSGLASNTKYCAEITAENNSGVSQGEQVSFESAEAKYALAVTIAGAGSGTVSGDGITCSMATCTSTLEGGARVSLAATPAAGSTFAGWSGACAGAGTCEVTMNEAESVTATFALSPPPGPSESGPPGNGSAGGSSGSTGSNSVEPPRVEVEPAKEGASLLVAGRKISVMSNGEALVKLRCHGKAPCSGKLRLTVVKRVDVHGRKATRTITIGAATCSIRAGGSGTVKIRLSHAALAMLDLAHGHLAGRLFVAGTSGTAPSLPATKRVTLIAKLKNRKRK